MIKIAKYSLATLCYTLLFIGTMLIFSQVNVQPSQAATSCSGTSICISLHQGWTGNTSSGGQGGGNSGPGGGGSSETTVKPKPPERVCDVGAHYTIREDAQLPTIPGGWHTLSSNCVNKYKVRTKFHNITNGWMCGPSSEGGITRNSVGYIEATIDIVKIAKRYNPESGVTTRSYYGYDNLKTEFNCIYPKMSKVATNKYCALNANGTFDRLANSRSGAGRIKTFKTNIATVNGLKTGSDICKQSAVMNFSSGLKSSEKTWGQYKLSGKIQFVRCTEYKVTFDGNVKRQFNCGGTQSTPAVVAHATLWCGGVANGLLNKSWTMNDCINSPKGGYTCTVPAPMYDGKKGTVQTLRDGKSRVLNWGTPKTGNSVRSTKNWEQAVTINGGSSPRLTSVGDNDKAKQMFWSNVNFGTKWVASKNQQNIAFYNASNPGKSWSATRKLRFDGQFKTIVGDLGSYNPWTGKFSSTQRTVWVNDYNIKCNTATSPNVQALRSIGDAQ